MKTILIIGVFCIIGFLFNTGEPVPGAEVYIEQENSDQPYAFLQTGQSGLATFDHLPAGVYRVMVVLPQQSGKLMRGRDRMNINLQVGFHGDKNDYYLQEPEGCFVISFSKLRRISGITPIYNQQTIDRSKRYSIGKFEVNRNDGRVSLKIHAFTPKRFQKKVEKAREDVSMSVIKNTN